MDKTHILREIRRTAEANAGSPLGIDRFESQTGIRRNDWYGVYWSRWGDALVEAGFAPNQLQGAYELAELLQKYADLALRLGRLPVSGDLRMEARNNPGFPAHTTFSRLGPKSGLIEQLAGWCRSHDGYEEVLSWCDQPKADKRAVGRDSDQTSTPIGFVYLARAGRFYKIGKTNAVGRRQYELAIQLPERAKTVHAIRTDDPAGIEAYWHKRFEPKRKNGEWFQLGVDDVAAFRRRKFM